MNFLSKESEYLIDLIRCAITENDLPPAPPDLDWEKVLALSKEQQVYSIIAEAVDPSILPDKQRQELDVYNKNELLRIVAMKAELESIENELKEKKIKFMLLKGSVLRNYYPKQRMRQMSDIDILYDESKRDTLVKIMKSMGYRLTAACENSDDFFKEPFYTFEFHRELFFEESSFCPRFNLWKNATFDRENEFEYHINPTQHFVYTLCHMYKHYSTYGCGIRFLCDIFLQLKSTESNIDLDTAFSEFKKIGIYDFSNDAITLSNAIFNKTEINENQQDMLDFLISNGIYGSHITDYNEEINKYGGTKFKYLMHRVFPSKSMMKRDYKILNKKPFLLPFYYIYRLADKSKHNGKKAIKELKDIKDIKK